MILSKTVLMLNRTSSNGAVTKMRLALSCKVVGLLNMYVLLCSSVLFAPPITAADDAKKQCYEVVRQFVKTMLDAGADIDSMISPRGTNEVKKERRAAFHRRVKEMRRYIQKFDKFDKKKEFTIELIKDITAGRVDDQGSRIVNFSAILKFKYFRMNIDFQRIEISGGSFVIKDGISYKTEIKFIKSKPPEVQAFIKADRMHTKVKFILHNIAKTLDHYSQKHGVESVKFIDFKNQILAIKTPGRDRMLLYFGTHSCDYRIESVSSDSIPELPEVLLNMKTIVIATHDSNKYNRYVMGENGDQLYMQKPGSTHWTQAQFNIQLNP